jgi:acetolactate synthase-1/2/3 large subunit
MATCAQIIADTFKQSGIQRIFGLPGGEILDVMEARREAGLQFILTRHEAAAAYMADVTGQITGIPGVCLATVGPGATNLVNGVANAYLDRSPVLVLTAQLSTVSQPYATHQFIPLERLFDPITKSVFTLSGRDTRRSIEEGVRMAIAGPKGPVYFCLPSDIAKIEEGSRHEDLPHIPRENVQETDSVTRAIEEMKKAEKPLILLGIGIDPREETEAVRAFIKKNRFPVMATCKAKGIFSEADPLYLGTASGMMADDLIVDRIKRADLVVGIGFDPVESDKIWHKDIKLLSINGYRIAYQRFAPYMEVQGKIGSTLHRMMKEDFSHHRWKVEELHQFKETLGRKLTPSGKPHAGTFSPYEAIQRMRKVLPEDTVVTTDVGAHKCLMGQLWKVYHPLTFFMSNGLSSMGYGFPAAMAAKLCRPESPVVCVTGDGSFSMMLQELETAVRLRLPVVILVMCDQSLGLIELVQRRRGYPPHGVRFNRIKFASAAKAFGARGINLRSLEELPEIFSKAFRLKVPTVIEIPVDASEYDGQL